MSQNMSPPYIIQINEPIPTIQLTEEIRFDNNSGQLSGSSAINNHQLIVSPLEQSPGTISQDLQILEQEQPCVVHMVYPHELSLDHVQNAIKRGRPKKKNKLKKQAVEEPRSKQEPVIKLPQGRTRSGRLVKLPKHMETDFKKIEITSDEQEVTVSDFHTYHEKENRNKIEFAQFQRRKRLISNQFKCPKCFKAYLGKNKMIEHLKKHPDHGPLPEGFQEFNFDVWNYLFDITQKCKSGQRGIKFCEELSNLLHNVQLLKSALFKTVTDSKNCVHIDKVLGNAIGLAPGKYKFDENELYKDVTVLKLITNSDFFQPSVVNKQPKNSDEPIMEFNENKKPKPDHEHGFTSLAMNNETACENHDEMYDFSTKSATSSSDCLTKVHETGVKKSELDQITLSGDLLTEENLLLHSLPDSKTPVEELMLSGVDNGSSLLDNSTSSDEVMNVDQFVNERFKKIIEPDIELANPGLNLDLPGLEMFQFNTS